MEFILKKLLERESGKYDIPRSGTVCSLPLGFPSGDKSKEIKNEATF